MSVIVVQYNRIRAHLKQNTVSGSLSDERHSFIGRSTTRNENKSVIIFPIIFVFSHNRQIECRQQVTTISMQPNTFFFHLSMILLPSNLLWFWIIC